MAGFLREERLLSMYFQSDVVPALEHLAADEEWRNKLLDRRFGRDEPPPYRSSPEPEDDEEIMRMVLGISSLPPHIAALLEAPLSKKEQSSIASHVACAYQPGVVFLRELQREVQSVKRCYHGLSQLALDFMHGCDLTTNKLLANQLGTKRAYIIARHRIKQRWQALGVWGSDWGVPSIWPSETGIPPVENVQPRDNPSTWHWPWANDEGAAPAWHQYQKTASIFDTRDDVRNMTCNSRHPVVRAIELRRGLERGEYSHPPPRSRLAPATLPAIAEDFVASRPWFTYILEVREQSQRHRRTACLPGHFKLGAPDEVVVERWGKRGDWDDSWNVGTPAYKQDHMPGWKWRHESPEPEVDDVKLLNNLNMELTPSEADALETIQPPALPSEDYTDNAWSVNAKLIAQYIAGMTSAAHPDRKPIIEGGGAGGDIGNIGDIGDIRGDVGDQRKTDPNTQYHLPLSPPPQKRTKPASNRSNQPNRGRARKLAQPHVQQRLSPRRSARIAAHLLEELPPRADVAPRKRRRPTTTGQLGQGKATAATKQRTGTSQRGKPSGVTKNTSTRTTRRQNNG